MKRNLTRKNPCAHLNKGELVPGREDGHHALLQDATGAVVMLEFEAIGIGT